MWVLLMLCAWASEPVSPAPVCPVTVADLPAATWLDPADPRLRGDDLVVVLKSQRALGLYAGGVLAPGESCWRVGLGGAPEGHKRREGDNRTPEGWYRSSDKPASRFYAAIAVHYPNHDDAAAGERAGTIDAATRRRIQDALRVGEKPPQYTALGGEILIHGGGSWTDWTLGCVALDDRDLDALRAQLPSGMATQVLILP